MRKIGVATLLAIASYGSSPRLTVSRDTTYFTRPLHPDGGVDYAAALNELYGSRVTPENNAAVPLMAVLGDAVPEPAAKQMGLPQAPPPTERFLGGVWDWSKYIEWRRERGRPLPANANRQLDKELLATTQRPWPAKDHPLLADWLGDMNRPLEAVDQATMRPRYWIPLASPLSGNPIKGLVIRRNVAMALRSRAMLGLSEGDPDGAARDVLTIVRLASRQARQPSLIELLIAVAIAQIGTEALPPVAADPKLSQAALVRMLCELETLEPLPPPAEKIGNFERAMLLEETVRAAIRGKSEAIDLRHLNPDLVDWDEVLKTINRCYDLEIACIEAPTAEARRATCDERDRLLPKDQRPVEEILKDGASPTATAMLVFKTVVAMTLPSLDRTQVSFNETKALDRLGRSALVLRAYREKWGRFPDRLESVSAPERYGVSVASDQQGYRFALHTGQKGGYAYTAVPDEPGISGVRSFCIDGTGRLVTLGDGAEPKVQDARCAND